MNKAQHLLARAGGVALGLAAPLITFAQSRENPFNRSQNLLNNTRTASGVTGGSDLPTIIGSLINVVLGFLGIVLLFYVLRAGFLWMTAGGDEKQVKTAKDMIRDLKLSYNKARQATITKEIRAIVGGAEALNN